MTLEEFSKDLREDVQTYAVTDGNFSRSAFVDCCANRLQEANILNDFTPCFFKGTGEKKRALELDGYSFDELDDSFSIVIADYRKFSVLPSEEFPFGESGREVERRDRRQPPRSWIGSGIAAAQSLYSALQALHHHRCGNERAHQGSPRRQHFGNSMRSPHLGYFTFLSSSLLADRR